MSQDNIFVKTLFDWNQPSRKVALVNGILQRFGVKSRLVSPVDPWKEMTSIEQRMNLYHLLSQVLRHHVPGDVAEFGSFTGETVALMQKINLSEADPPRRLHVFDSFEAQFAVDRPIQEVLEENFRSRDLPLPQIHRGRFDATIPGELPDTIAFAHIDCGDGGDPVLHAELVTFCLEQIWPRVPRGGVILLMDYVRPSAWKSWEGNSGVAVAADAFVADKREEVTLLYAGEMSQGVIHKL